MFNKDNGKVYDYILEVSDYDGITVWADPDLKDLFLTVEGVLSVFSNLHKTEYDISVDKRYDIITVAKNIVDKLEEYYNNKENK